MRWFIWFILFATVVAGSVFEGSVSQAQGFDPVLASRLQETLDSMRTSGGIGPCIKGISAGVYIPGEGTWLGVSGVSHGNVSITPGMFFGIGSQTKLFISVLMLRLAELGVLSIDDRIDQWLPSIQYVDPSITIRQLLNHTSGVYNVREKSNCYGKMTSHPEKIWTPEEVLSTFLDPPYFSPGEGWHYSNTNYILAGMIVEAATGASVSYNLRQYVLDPLDLDDTYLSIEETIPDTVSHRWLNCHDLGDLSLNSWSSAFWTAGAMFSTADNMLRFYSAIFEGQILNQSSRDQLFDYVATGQFPEYYGLGISIAKLGGRTLIGHGGSFWYRSLTVLDSLGGFTTTVLINGTDELPNNEFNADLTLALGATILGYSMPRVSAEVSGQETTPPVIPAEFRLAQNYPNPFNPTTTIRYSLGEETHVTLRIYNMLGQLLSTLVNGNQKAGFHESIWNGSSDFGQKVASGMYIARLTAGKFSSTKRMLLLK